MSYNGSGVYTLPGAALANGNIVSATENNQFRNDVAAALNVAWTRDGQAPATANIPMGTFKFTGLGAGTGNGDSVRFEQLPSATNKLDLTTSVTGTLPVGNGGTGATTLTGLVKGNGTSAFTAASAGTDYQAAISATGLLKGAGSGSVSAAAAGTDYLAPAAIGTTVQAYNAELQGATQGGINGMKNRIINGAMNNAQRATSATITAGSTIAAGYSTVDRFYVYCTGANVTAAQVAGSGATQNRLQITGAASVTAVGVGQRIEQFNSYDLAGSTATLSVDLANSLLTTVTWTAYYANTANTFGTLASPTRTQIATGTFTVTSTVINYNTQISVPAAATTGIEIVFTVGAQTSGTWTIGNVQLEKGSTATSFDYRPYGTELALCQRYYQKVNCALGQAKDNGNVYAGSLYYKTTMRASPTLDSGASFTVSTGSAGTPGILNQTGSPTSPDSQYIFNSGGNWTTDAYVQLTAGFTAEL